MSLKVVFMGTPDFALPALERLVSKHDVCAVLTGEDKPRGRGHEVVYTPIKKYALEHGIETYTPRTLKDEDIQEKLASYGADVFVVAAYGKILPRRILDMPRLGCVNIHGSLLPSYRGAAPIQWSIIDGREKTGITTMLMNEGLDTGDILEKYEVDILPDETGGSLFDKLSKLGADAIEDTLDRLSSGQITPVPQDDTDTEYAKIITKDMAHIDWNTSSRWLERYVRSFDPFPGSYTNLHGNIIKIWRLEVLEDDSSDTIMPGSIQIDTTLGIKVKTGDGWVLIKQLQKAGKKRMSSKDFLNGNKISANDRFE